MPNINPNSTNYVHSSEPNTNDLHMAMGYDPQGKPVLRVDSTDNLSAVVLPSAFQAATLDNTGIFYRLIKNGTLTNPVWVDVLPGVGFTEYDQSATAITGGTIVDSGFISSGNQGLRIDLNPDARYQLGRSSMGTVSDTLTVAVVGTSANKSGYAAISWTEIR